MVWSKTGMASAEVWLQQPPVWALPFMITHVLSFFLWFGFCICFCFCLDVVFLKQSHITHASLKLMA